MTTKPILIALALSAIFATGMIPTASNAQTAANCPPGVTCPPNGGQQPGGNPPNGGQMNNQGNNGPMHRPHRMPNGGQPNGGQVQNPGGNSQNSGGMNSGNNQQRHWHHRNGYNGAFGYPNSGVGVGIYLGNGYDSGYRWHHHQHCKLVKVWRHHHRVLVKRCVWHR